LIRLSTFENRKFETIKNISQDCFDALISDSELLKNVHTQFVIFKYLQLNITEYSNHLRKISNLPNGTVDIKKITSPELLLETNKIILNLLSSFKFFLDNGESFLKRKYGKDSIIVKEFIQLTRKIHGESFAYRFLSKLRNYSIHLGFPFQGLEFKTEKNKDNPEKAIGSLQLLIDIDLIKKEKDLFGSVHKEFSDLNEDIDIKPLIRDLSISILNIQEYIYNVQKEEIENSIENIETFTGDFKTNDNEIKVFNNLTRDGEMIRFNAYHVPFEIISDFKIYKNNRC
jgi:hypothetical protein